MPPDLAGTTQIWIQWSATTTTATAASNTVQIWDFWTATNATGGNVSQVSYRPVELTPEQRAEREREAEERKRNLEASRERARALLLAVLDKKQQRELEKDGYFHVETKDGTRRYRLRPGAAPVRVHGEDGRRWSYCIHPAGGFPADDVVVAHKLLLETDEEAFLQTANASAA